MSYLANLTLRLAAGAARFPEELRRRHAAFLTESQGEDGGFAGRQGPSDLYYTSFALRGLALLDGISEGLAHRTARFLQARLGDEMSSLDLLSLVFSAVVLETASAVDVFAAAGHDRKAAVTAALEPFRRDDGGYAKSAQSPISSTYHTFLAAACKALAGVPIDDASPICRLIRSRRREDGGFVELGQLTRSGTNPTAAAVGVLRLVDAVDEPTRQGAAAFLSQMQNAEGGFRAHSRIPVADLLSTFTGLVALADLDALSTIDAGRARRYVQRLDRPEGGFRGGAWDHEADVEYTFYGLGSLALLAGLDG